VFERFTDRARRVLVLAQEEARLLNHSFIGTEHVLLGLIHEGDGVAAKALESLGISLQAVREKVADTIGPAGSGPTGSPPFTPRAKKVLELALREALQLGHNYIGTEHILLGLVREGEGVAAQILQSFGADLGRVREKVIELLLTGVQGREFTAAQRVGDFPAMVAAGGAGMPELKYPYKVLAGPARSLGSTTLGVRIVGLLLFDDGISVIWRLHGVPSAVTRLVENATATSEFSRNARLLPGMRPEIRRMATRPPQPRRPELEPYIVLSDDLRTAFREIETTFKALESGEWAGSSDFNPSLPEGASTVTLAWEGDSITLSL
jgi:hypothetical protein